jgi:hypothetical protein
LPSAYSMREWFATDVFDQQHQVVLDQLGEHGELDWSRASLDSVSAGQEDDMRRDPLSSGAWWVRRL